MKRVITAVVLASLVLVILFKGTFPVVLVATAIIAELAAWEYLSLAGAAGAKAPRILVLVAIALLFLATFYAATFPTADLEFAAIVLCSLGLFAVCTFRSPVERMLADIASSVFALVYIGASLTTLPLLWEEEHGSSLLLFLFCVVWSGDIAALYAGRTFGRRQLAPRISPNKTWVGSAASMAASLSIAAVLFYLARSLEGGSILSLTYSGPIGRWLLLAALLNLAAQVGDLAESAIKRGSGAKDSGIMLPGHGGVLDRIDALLLAAPLLWYAQLAQQYFWGT